MKPSLVVALPLAVGLSAAAPLPNAEPSAVADAPAKRAASAAPAAGARNVVHLERPTKEGEKHPKRDAAAEPADPDLGSLWNDPVLIPYAPELVAILKGLSTEDATRATAQFKQELATKHAKRDAEAGRGGSGGRGGRSDGRTPGGKPDSPDSGDAAEPSGDIHADTVRTNNEGGRSGRKFVGAKARRGADAGAGAESTGGESGALDARGLRDFVEEKIVTKPNGGCSVM